MKIDPVTVFLCTYLALCAALALYALRLRRDPSKTAAATVILIGAVGAGGIGLLAPLAFSWLGVRI